MGYRPPSAVLQRTCAPNPCRTAARSRQSLQQSIRGAWVHILYPDAPEDAVRAAGFTMRSTRLSNRGGLKPIPEAVWAKAQSDGTVLDTLGPGNLAKELESLWPAEKQPLTVADIRDWFASFVYLPRVRDDAVLDTALQYLCTDMEFPYAYASGFDEDADIYRDVVDGKAWLSADLGTGLLVRREAIQTEVPTPTPISPGLTSLPDPIPPTPPSPGEPTSARTPQPTRFFASIAIDPDRAGIEVARIMDGLLMAGRRSLKDAGDFRSRSGRGWRSEAIREVQEILSSSAGSQSRPR